MEIGATSLNWNNIVLNPPNFLVKRLKGMDHHNAEHGTLFLISGSHGKWMIVNKVCRRVKLSIIDLGPIIRLRYSLNNLERNDEECPKQNNWRR